MEASLTASFSSDDDTDSTEESDSEYDSAQDSDVNMRMEDDVDAPCSVVLDGDVVLERDGDDEEEEDEEEEDEVEKDEEEEDQDEVQDEDDDDGKEPRRIGQGEMVNTSADDVNTVVDDQPIVLPVQGQEMHDHTPRPQPLAPAPRPQPLDPAPRPQTLDPRPRRRTPETHPLGWLEYSGLVTPHRACPAVPTLREAEPPGNTSDVDVNQQLLGKLAGGDSLPDALLPDVPLLDFPLPGAHPDCSVGEEWTSPRVA